MKVDKGPNAKPLFLETTPVRFHHWRGLILPGTIHCLPAHLVAVVMVVKEFQTEQPIETCPGPEQPGERGGGGGRNLSRDILKWLDELAVQQPNKITLRVPLVLNHIL